MQGQFDVLEPQPVTQERVRPVSAGRAAPMERQASTYPSIPADRMGPAERPTPAERQAPFDPTRDLRRAFEEGRRRGRQEAIVTAIVIGAIAGLVVAAMIYGVIQSAMME